MSEDAEMWEEYRGQNKEKRWKNFEQSIKLLDERGITYEILNREVGHLKVYGWSFWPTTGKFYNEKTGEKGRGVFNLIKKL